MANTYHKIYIHTITVVKYRNSLIQPEWESNLHSVIGNLINESGGKTIIINGVHDHVHCFFYLKPSSTISDIMQVAKAKSSKWVNSNGLTNRRFQWQTGFACFSNGYSQAEHIYSYIKNQREHHKHVSFRDEYEKLLNDHGIEYEDGFIFRDPE